LRRIDRYLEERIRILENSNQNQLTATALWYPAPVMSKPIPERRSGKRLPLRLPISIQNGKLKTSGLTRDLNTSGIFLYTPSRVTEGSELEMVLILPPEITGGEKQWVCCRASVVRVEDSLDGGDFGVAAHIRSIEALPEIPG
jgi:hypothetical protein